MFIWLFILPILLLSDAEAALSGDKEPLLKEEIERLSLVIEASEQTLERLKYLSTLLYDYQEKLTYYIDHGEEKIAALQVAKVAAKILEEIKENFLTDLFDAEFISEVTLFSQLGQKKGLVAPSSL